MEYLLALYEGERRKVFGFNRDRFIVKGVDHTPQIGSQVTIPMGFPDDTLAGKYRIFDIEEALQKEHPYGTFKGQKTIVHARRENCLETKLPKVQIMPAKKEWHDSAADRYPTAADAVHELVEREHQGGVILPTDSNEREPTYNSMTQPTPNISDNQPTQSAQPVRYEDHADYLDKILNQISLGQASPL